MVEERGGGEWGGETVLNNIFKNGFIFLKCTDCRDFFSKIVLIVRILKNVRIFFENCTDCMDFFFENCTDFF